MRNTLAKPDHDSTQLKETSSENLDSSKIRPVDYPVLAEIAPKDCFTTQDRPVYEKRPGVKKKKRGS